MEELSAVGLLQQIFSDALERQVSDIHLHCTQTDFTVQFRIRGQLVQYLHAHRIGPSVVRRIKALAKMDVAESRLPQDGAFCWQSDVVHCDVRVASVPTVNGEAVVLRLLVQQRGPLTFTSLGMTQAQAETVNKLLQCPSGMVLVAGPTGSGKTTTLYAMMLQLSRWGRHVVSIEDPVEMPVPYCHQVEVREHVGVTFNLGLKALLRQDPDVIMIGEIRDEESARVSLRAAMSGHLVLSTTHARDLVGAAARLVEFGLPRSLVGDVLRAVIVQELHMTSCPSCRGAGCTTCGGSGIHSERRAGFEIHQMSLEMIKWFASDMSWPALRERVESSVMVGRDHRRDMSSVGETKWS